MLHVKCWYTWSRARSLRAGKVSRKRRSVKQTWNLVGIWRSREEKKN